MIKILVEDIREVLEDRLERKPTKKELEGFIGYVEVDIPQWLSDNVRSYVRDVLTGE